MAFLQLEMSSPSMGKATTVNIIINQMAKPPYPVYYLLHGLSGDHSTWVRRTSLERYAEEYPFMIVMPDGLRGFYTDSPVGNIESYLIKDLVPFIENNFNVRKQRRWRAIGGLSMGGYGSMKLALKYHNLFGHVASHSSAFCFAHETRADWEKITDLKLIESLANPETSSVYRLAEKCPKSKLPGIYFDCGREDFLHYSNEDFHKFLNRKKIKHTYKRFSGEHNWAYWDEHIKDAMAFVAKSMGLK